MIGNILGALVLALVGLALLTVGYRWFRLLLPIWAFFVGTGAVTALMSGIFGQSAFVTALACVPAVLVGLVFAVLSYVWWSLAVLFWAGTVGYVLFAGLLSALGINGWLILFLAGAAGAVLFVIIGMRAELRKFLPIFLTAGAGATLLLTAVLVLFGRPVEELNWGTVYGPLSSGASGSFLAIVIWIVLTGVGIGIQTAMNKSLEVDMARYEAQRMGGAM
jgi:hypothetical protein